MRRLLDGGTYSGLNVHGHRMHHLAKGETEKNMALGDRFQKPRGGTSLSEERLNSQRGRGS